MKQAAFRVGLLAVTALVFGCTKSDFPTTPSPVALTPLTTLSALKVGGTASLPGGRLTPFNMTLIARSVSITAPGAHAQARQEAQAQAPGTTEVTGNFELGTGLEGTVTGTVEGSLESGTLRGTLRSSADGCTRQYSGPVSAGGFAWITSDASGSCALPITVQASPANSSAPCTYTVAPLGTIPGSGTTAVLNITTGPKCAWVVQAVSPWLKLTGPSTGVGSATVTLVVDPTEDARQGTVLVAGESVTINQAQTCTVTVATGAIAFPEGGGSRPITVTAPTGCLWRTDNVPLWISLSPSSGNGTTTVTLFAQPNSGA
ncbi:MAG: hypothetical protein ABI024_10525, partial [Vicinamibacterales bacterium]